MRPIVLVLAAAALAFPLAARAQVPGGEGGAPPTEPPSEPAPAQPPAAKPEPAPPPAAKGPAAPPTAPAPAAAEPAAEFVEPPALRLGPVALSPIVLVQVHATPFVGDDAFVQSGDLAEQEGFRLRRARFGISGELAQRAAFAVSVELGSSDDGQARIHDGWAGWTQLPYVQVRAGALELPYSRSALVSAGDQAFVERPLAVRSMAPGNQVGARVDGKVSVVGYQLGLFNALQRGDQFYAGYQENYAAFGNRYGGVALAGRLGVEPLGAVGRTIDDPAHSPVRVGVGGSYFFSNGGARDVHGLGGDALLHVAGFHALVEVLYQKSIPESVPTQATNLTAEVQSTAFVGELGYAILARRLGVAARLEWIDPSSKVDNEGDQVVLGGAVTLRILGEWLKAQAEYDHREELHGQKIANDALTLALQLHL